MIFKHKLFKTFLEIVILETLDYLSLVCLFLILNQSSKRRFLTDFDVDGIGSSFSEPESSSFA